MALLRKTFLCNPRFLTISARYFTVQNQNSITFPDEPTSAYYDELVNSAGRIRDFDTIRLLLHKRFRDGFVCTNNTFGFIDNKETSRSVIDELFQTIAGVEEGYPRKSAYDSLIARLCKLNLIEESLRVVNTMAHGGHGLNACTFHPIFNSLTRKKNLEEAWHVVDLMRKLEVPPDLTVYNYFLTTHCFSGDLEAAAGVLTTMVEEGMRPDTRTYDALILGACKAEKVESAMVLLRRMEDDGLPVLFSTHVYVLDTMLGLRYYEEAVEFVMCYAGRDTWLDTESFGWLANRFIKLKRLEKAKFMLEEMDKRGLAMGDKLKSFYEMKVKTQN